MVWDVMVAAALVVVSVAAVLACFHVKHVLTWLKKPHRRNSIVPRLNDPFSPPF
jgi:hypothetical protein